MRRFRVLMTVDAVGGVWHYAHDLAAALRPFGVETVIAQLGPPPSAAQRRDAGADVPLVETGLDLDWLARDAAAVDAAGDAISALAIEHGADLVHLNQPALAASAHFNVPVVAAIHSCLATWWEAVRGGAIPRNFVWQTDLVSRGLRRADAVVAPSHAFADAVARAYALREPPHVVPNGRSFPLHRPEPREASVFTAGRLWDKAKGMATLDRAAARLSLPFAAAGATRCSNGESIDLQHIEAVGSLDIPALAARLARQPVFASAARYEPFGLAVLEAASAGCALVLSDIPTFRENWDGAALFVTPDDAEGFAAAIGSLLSCADTRDLQGRRAQERAGRFTRARMGAGLQAIYAQVLASRAERDDAA